MDLTFVLELVILYMQELHSFNDSTTMERTMIARFLTTIFLIASTTLRVSNTDSERLIKQDGVSVSVERGEELLAFIKEQCRVNKVPVRLVHNVISIESHWRYPDKGEIVGDKMMQSSEDAYGLMQVQVPTAQEMLDDITITPYRLMTDDTLNVKAGIVYLAWLRDYYHGNWYFAIAAYNRGIGFVNKDIRNNFIPLNDYAYNACEGVFFGKRLTVKMDSILAKMLEKSDFQSEVIAAVQWF